MLDPKQVKKFEKIIKKLLVARSNDIRMTMLQGFEYITGEFDGESTGRITATDGHILFRYYMTPDEREYFERCELPRYFSNGENVFFTAKSDAADNKNVKYPNVDIIIPKDTFDISIPVYFDPRNLVKACDFLSAEVGRTIPTFYPQFSTNAKYSGTGHLCGPAVVVRVKATALVMPFRVGSLYN